jgi:hypothetical protein
MVWGVGGWSIMRSAMNPSLYYKLDGTQPISADFQAGGFKLINVANGTSSNDAVNFSQLSGKVDKSGDTISGDLTVLGNIRVGDGLSYNSIAVQATATENAPLFFLREDGQNAGVIFYDSVYKVLRFIKYSESDPTQIIGQAFLDEHGDFVTSNDLLSGDNVTATSSINVGTNANGNSAIRFTDDATGVPVLFWNNVDKEFQVDVDADEGYTLFHSGNVQTLNYEPVHNEFWSNGVDTEIEIPVAQAKVVSVFSDGILLNPLTEYNVEVGTDSVTVSLNTAPATEACVHYYSPVSDSILAKPIVSLIGV